MGARPDEKRQDGQGHNGAGKDAETFAIDGPAEDHGDENQPEGRDDDFGLGDESLGGDDGEDGNNQGQGEPQKQGQNGLGSSAQDPARDVGERAAAVSNRRHERCVVVNGAEENAAERDPENGAEPTEIHDGEKRPEDRSGAGDRGKVMTEEKHLLGRGIIDVVAVFAGRGGPTRIGPDDLFFDECAVYPVSDKKPGQEKSCNEQRVHADNILQFPATAKIAGGYAGRPD